MGEQFFAARPDEQRVTLVEVVKQIEVGHDRIRLDLDAEALRASLKIGTPDDERRPDGGPWPIIIKTDLPVRFKRRGAEMKLILADDRGLTRTPDPNLVDLVVQARTWFDQLATGEVPSARDLAARHDLDPGDVSRGLPLAFLAPDIVEAILEGRQPVELTASRLKRMHKLPLSWAEQRHQLGFE